MEPKVTLVTWTNNPIKAIASQLLNMQGKMHHNLDEIDEEYAISLVRDLKKTALAGGLEVVDMLFQIENVPRSLTHQMVRTRVGATYHQESLRFTTRKEGFDYDIGPTILNSKADTVGCCEQSPVEIFTDTMIGLADTYRALVEAGVSTEDARGVLPINTLTKIGVKYNFKTLVHCANVRLCYQSQAHWKSIFKQIKGEIFEKVHPVLAEFLVPICSVTGRCEYKSIFDRKCPIEQKLIDDTCKKCIHNGSCNNYCEALKRFHRLEV
jgi:thymidylate synthase (FAD)